MSKFLIFLIDFYKKSISPFLSDRGVHCKFYPTCSEYLRQALQKYGCIKGLWLGTKRFFKCNPFSKGGYDPLV